MQTNEIAFLPDGCKTQAPECAAKSAAVDGFVKTLTEALVNSVDGQNLPVEDKDPEDPASKSAEAGNCSALSWIVPFLNTPTPTIPVNVTAPDLPPNSGGDAIQQTSLETATVTPSADLHPMPVSMDGTPATAGVPASDSKDIPATPGPTSPQWISTAGGPPNSVPAKTFVSVVPEDVRNVQKAEGAQGKPGMETGSAEPKRKAGIKLKDDAASQVDAVSSSKSDQEPVSVPATPVMPATDIPLQMFETKIPVQRSETSQINGIGASESKASPEVSNSVAPVRLPNGPLPEPVRKSRAADSNVSAAGPAMVSSESAKVEVGEATLSSHEGNERGNETNRKEKTPKSARPEPDGGARNRVENHAPVVSSLSGSENKGASNSQQDKDQTQKHEPAPEVFQNMIHRVVSSPSAAVVEEAKPTMMVGQTPLEPAAVHRAAVNLSGTVSTAPGTEVLTETQKASVVSQLVDKAQLLVKDNNSEIVIALKPDSLGRITLRASMVDNELVTTIVAESHAVKAMLQADLPALHSVLQEAGMESAKVIVVKETDMNFAGGPSNNSFGFQQPQHSHHQQGTPSRWYEDLPLTDMDSSNSERASVPVSKDSRYSARSIHFIA